MIRIIFIVFSLLLLAATLTHYRVPFHPTVWDHPGRAIGVLALGVVFFLVPQLAGFRKKLAAWLYETRNRNFNAAVLVIGVLMYSIWAHKLLGGIPHIDDSVAAVWGAELFLSGNLKLPMPENPEFVECFGVLGDRANAGWWACMYPPGWSVFLMPFVAVGVSWLANPILGACLAITCGAIARELFDKRTGRIVALVTLFSPFVGGLAAMQLSHMATGWAGALAWLHVLRLLRTGRAYHGAIAGCALGFALLCRPVTAVIIGCAIGIAPLVRWRDSLKAWKGVIFAVVAVLLCAGLLLAYQEVVTGDAMTPGHKLAMKERGRIGFVRLDAAREHTVEIGLRYTGLRMDALNRLLLGWPIPSMLMALLPLAISQRRWIAAWLLIPAFLLAMFYMAFWYFEEYYPARYLFSGTPYLLILAGWAISILCFELSSNRVRQVASGLIAGSMLFTLACSNEDFHDFFNDQHGDVEPILEQVVEAYGIDNAVVFMDSVGRMDTEWDNRNDYYASGFRLNSLSLDGPVIYVRNLPDADNNRVVEQYPGRRYYLYRFDRGACRAWLYDYPIGPDGKLSEPVRIEPRDELLMTGQTPPP